MSGEVLYRKWRPQTFHEVVGQETVTTTLRNAVRAGRAGHAYLFSGPRGTGKTSTGRILAKAVNCLDPRDGEPCNKCEACVSITEGRCLDVVEIDAASNRGIDDIRNLRERVGYAAGTVRRKVYIIDEVHMLTDPASNALLKTLEEPPPHVMFVLATTELHKVLPTIISRCQSFNFRRLGLSSVVAKLGTVAAQEGVHAAGDSLVLVARSASGSLRDAENLLQQLVASHGVELEEEEVRAALGVADRSLVLQLISNIVSKDIEAALRAVYAANQSGMDLRHFGRETVSLLRSLLLIRSGCADIVEVGEEEKAALEGLAQSVDSETVARSTRLFSEAVNRDVSQQALALELAAVDSIIQTQKPVLAAATEPQQSAAPHAAAKPASRERTPRKPRSVVTGHATQTVPQTAQQSQDALSAVRPEGADASVQEPKSEAEPYTEVASLPPESFVEAPAEDTEGLPSESEDRSELGMIRGRWKEYVDSLRGLGSRGSLDAVLRSGCEPAALEDGVLVLRFDHQFLKGKLDDDKSIQLIEERLQSFYGRPLKVSLVVGGQEPAPSAPSAEIPEQTDANLLSAAHRMGWRSRQR